MDEQSARVEDAIREAQRIREAFNDITSVQDKALLAHFGIAEETGSNTDDTDAEISAPTEFDSKLTAELTALQKSSL